MIPPCALRGILLVLTLALGVAAPAQEAGGAGARVVAIGMTVSDLERSIAFFRDVLGFATLGVEERAGEAEDNLTGIFACRRQVARLRLGKEEIELSRYVAPAGRTPLEGRSHDRWFQHAAIVVRDMEAAWARLRVHKVAQISPSPQRIPDWNTAAAGIEALYFLDPDGQPLELIRYPASLAAPRWREPGDALFLGIDHTAIVVADTARSRAFWEGILGFEVAGRSENHGTEQERLSGVFGARVRITGFAAPGGPGVEFLEYLTPADGRPRPRDRRACDLPHRHTTVRVRDARDVHRRLVAGRFELISPEPVRIGGRLAFRARDPDGHTVEVIGAEER